MKRRLISYKNFLLILLLDVTLLIGAWYTAYLLRFNFDIPENSVGMTIRLIALVVAVKLLVFYFFRLYQGMWRYTSLIDLFNIVKASVLSTLIILSLFIFSRNLVGFSRSIFVIDCVLTIMFISGIRVALRVYFESASGAKGNPLFPGRLFAGNRKKKDVINLLIIGAGDGGEKIHREIRDNARLKYRVVAYLDDDYSKQGKMIHGVPVKGSVNDLNSVARKMDIHEILIAAPSSSSEQMRRIMEICKQSDITYKTLPGLGELINGNITVNTIRDVAYRDLLGRGVVHLEEERIGAYLKNSRVLITGAGGSIGSELCRQICRFKPNTLILFEQAESPLYDIDLELRRDFPYVTIVPVLGDIRNKKRLLKTFEAHRPQTIYHAAAYKHVPMLEIQSWEAILNNVQGTRNVVRIAKQCGVERFVMVSTDKAVRPTNIMGATKRIAELMVQCQHGEEDNSTKFITVRFGNVVGSVGSVVPLFKRQIEMGGPVTITHPEVTRFFMTIPEASQLILQAGAMGKGGETFILEMGTSVKIVDMARDLIRLSGLEPDVDIKIQYIGLRPGEKLYEELITEGEGIVPTNHKKIMVIKGQPCNPMILDQQIDELIAFAKDQDDRKIRQMLRQIVPEYQPSDRRLKKRGLTPGS
ncbi:MAG: nucleoside-diphosphate sugar epimerase/dehydratase [Desulfobacterium sp.]|nr:nucleoside-diphosphate sugar epimerase/dehydratase [Desulfobacterium sp.]